MIHIVVIEASIAVALLIDEPKSRLARAFVRTCGVEGVLTLAAELGQQAAYDAHYLALAEALNCRFWTADRPFFTAARLVTDRVRWLGDFDPDADFNPDI